jgi:DNA-binding winged helix-turn-helix (wHTH) protein/TolB-like protein/Flp pilus assembly protein TadD
VQAEEYLFCRLKVLKDGLKLFLKEFLKASMRPENRQLYEFGPFRLDARKRRLSVDGEIVSLTPKAIETLLVLIERQGKLVEREELMNTVWADAFVEDSNLSVTISMLRKALGQGAEGEGSKYIETVPRLGYRFVADVREVTGEGPVIALEKRTQAQIVIEERSNDPEQPATIPSAERLSLPAAQLITFRAVALSVLLVGLIATLAYFWISRRSERTRTIGAVRSIAVLPFKIIGGASDDEYLQLGMTDALITKLSNQQQIVVRPMSSVRKYTAAGQDSAAIGRELRVDATLEGNVQRLGERVRVTVQLLNVSDGAPLWAEKFDEEFTNIFALEDRISDQAVQALMPKLSGEEKERVTKQYTTNAEAFHAYLKGRYFWNKRTEDGFRKAIEYFNQAVDKDPNFTLAHAGLADCYILLGIWGVLPPNEAMPQARGAALRSLKADDALAEGHVSLAFVKWVYDWDLPGADEEFKRAIQLNPNYAVAHHWRSYYLASIEQFDGALVEIKKAQELEGPLDLSTNTDVGEIYCWARQYDKGIEQLREVMQIEPNFAIARYNLGMAYSQTGRLREAVVELEAARLLDNSPRMMSGLGYAYGASGQRAKAQKIIQELDELSKQRYVSPFAIAVIYAGLGDQDEAVSWLEKAYAERSDVMVILKVYPWLNGLHANPRFIKLQQRVGLVP